MGFAVLNLKLYEKITQYIVPPSLLVALPSRSIFYNIYFSLEKTIMSIDTLKREMDGNEAQNRIEGICYCHILCHF